MEGHFLKLLKVIFFAQKNQKLNLTEPSVQSCLLSKCWNASELLTLYGLPYTGSSISADLLLQTLSPALLYQAQSRNCEMNNTTIPEIHETNKGEIWGYGILFVSIINLSSLVGIVVVPFMKKRIYHVVLMFLVALAVGVLCGSALLFLIPDALGLKEIDELRDVYPWKVMAVVGGIYLFFLVERILKIFMDGREKRGRQRRERRALANNSIGGSTEESTQAPESDGDNGIDLGEMVAYVKPDHAMTHSEEDLSFMNIPEIPLKNPLLKEDAEEQNSSDHEIVGHSHQIAPVAWMIIFGDSLHNFIDGLAIGASFADSTLAGISISVAVMCEEFPHELGDFAILLKSGMSVKKAVLFNFLSACWCYLGLAIGIVVGELPTASRWIFALAGGMFLYISLVDMMPEMNHVHSENGKALIGKKGAFLIQNIGLSAGFGLMLLLAIYSGEIDFTT